MEPLTSAPPTSSTVPHAQSPPTEAPPGMGDKLVVVLFLIGIAAFGVVLFGDLLRNLFRN